MKYVANLSDLKGRNQARMLKYNRNKLTASAKQRDASISQFLQHLLLPQEGRGGWQLTIKDTAKIEARLIWTLTTEGTTRFLGLKVIFRPDKSIP